MSNAFFTATGAGFYCGNMVVIVAVAEVAVAIGAFCMVATFHIAVTAFHFPVLAVGHISSAKQTKVIPLMIVITLAKRLTAGVTGVVFTVGTSVVAAFHLVMVIFVFTCANVVFATREGVVFPALAEIIVTMQTSNMFSFVAGVVAAF